MGTWRAGSQTPQLEFSTSANSWRCIADPSHLLDTLIIISISLLPKNYVKKIAFSSGKKKRSQLGKLFIKKKSSSMCRGGCTDLLLLLILLLFSIKSFLVASHAVWLPIVIGIDFALSKTKNSVVKRTTPSLHMLIETAFYSQIPIHHAAKSLVQSD